MTRTLTTAAVPSTKKTINPMDQPCFTTWTYEYNTHGAGYVGYDHNFNISFDDGKVGDCSNVDQYDIIETISQHLISKGVFKGVFNKEKLRDK